jgi:hypothetical protein
LLTFLWLLTGAAFLLALGAFARVRRVSKRLERLSESYWELRYEHGQLRSRLARLEPAPAGQGGHDPAGTAAGGHDPTQPVGGDREHPRAQAGGTAFVPLSSLKRPNETTVAE